MTVQTGITRASARALALWAPRLATGISLALLAACGDKAAEPETTRPVLTVELVSPSQESWPDSQVASGEVAAWQEASLGAELTGIRLEEVLVNVGDVVKKGQLLARYSEELLRAELIRLDAGVAEAEANLAKAKADAARADRLESTNALSGQAIQVYRTQAAVAEAQLASARALRGAQAVKLRHARVLAPDDGVISSRTATVGAVSAAGTELFRLVRGNRLEWRAEVPAELFARLKPGTQATVQGLASTEISGTLRQLAPTIDSGTRNGIAYVDLPAHSGLAAGMYLNGRFTLGNRAALVLPESAIVMRDGNRYLMRVDAQNHVQQVKVDTGRRQQSGIEILSGIAAGERYVKSGGVFVSHGDLVQVAAPGSTAP